MVAFVRVLVLQIPRLVCIVLCGGGVRDLDFITVSGSACGKTVGCTRTRSGSVESASYQALRGMYETSGLMWETVVLCGILRSLRRRLAEELGQESQVHPTGGARNAQGVERKEEGKKGTRRGRRWR